MEDKENPLSVVNKKTNNISSISIIVLSDGKPGHYNQSLGIMDSMKDIRYEVKQVKFKKKWRDNTTKSNNKTDISHQYKPKID